MYLSPEQAAQGVAATSADTYAFGAVLFELLAGEPAFRTDTSISDLIDSKRVGVLPKLTQFRSDLPEAVDEVVRRAMAPDPDDRYPDIAEMVMAFHASIAPRPEQRPTPLVLSRRNPYKGLAAFDEADAANFFGREELIDRLAGRVARSRFVAVVGPSGSGKSSVVRAGLAPRLRAQGDFVIAMIPGAHPIEELTRALLRATPVSQAEATRDALRVEGDGLVDAAAISLGDAEADLVVIVDQFEELFTISEELERQEFLRLIAAAARDDAGRVRVVATIRADFYDRPLSNAEISELVKEHTMAVTPLAPAELERAITGPAARAGVEVEPGLVAALIADSAGSPAGLPLVQYVLTDLYDRRHGDVLETATYHQRGGLTGAVARRADELYEQCDQAGREGVRRLFNRLVVPGEGTEDTRRRVRRSEIPTVPRQVIESYGAARLLTFDNDPTTREPTVEVAHEALIREWPLLRSWLDADREGLRIVGHVSGAADAWIESGRDPDELYRGGRLESVEDWLAAHPGGLNERELEFIDASKAARDALLAQRQERYDQQLRSNRRLRRLLVGVGAFAVLALLAGLFALQQRQRADDEAAQADFERLVALASTLPEQDLQVGMLAAVEAFDRQDRPESRGALQAALMTEPRFAGRVLSTGDAGPPTAGPNGEWFFATEVMPGEESSRGTWYDAATLEPMGSVTVDGRWRLISSPDRTLIAATWWDPSPRRYGDPRVIQVRLHDAGGSELGILTATGQPTAVHFLDADSLAVSDALGLTIWNLGTLEPESVIALPDSPRLEAIDVNTDGSLLLVSSPATSAGTAMVIDVGNEAVVSETVTPCEGRCAVRFAPSGEVAAIGGDGNVVLRDTASWDVISTIAVPDNIVDALDFSADGATLYVGTFEGDVALYDVRTGERSAQSIDARAGAILAVMTAPANHIITMSAPGVIQRWSVDRSGPFGTWLESGDGFGVFAPDSSRFVRTNDPDVGWITVYDPATGAVMEAIELIPDVHLGALAFSPDGRHLAIATNTIDVVAGGTLSVDEMLEVLWEGHPLGEIVLYDGETFEPTGPVLADQGMAFPKFSPDGQMLAVGANFTGREFFAAHLWQIDSGEVTVLEFPVDFQGAGRPSWSGDGTRVAFSDVGGGDAVFDAATGRQVGQRFSVRGQAEAREVLWEPDGLSLLGVGAPGISRWDLTTTERTSPFSEATSSQWMDLAADGRLLVTASDQSEARLWDLEAEVPVGIPFPDPGLMGILRDNRFPPVPALSPDGGYLALNGGNGTVLWTLDPQVWRELACELAGRNMTRNEWVNVMGDVPYSPTCDQWPPA
ncbi:MAG: AAA family ATPase [Acidimicrobiales bacterium]